MAFVDGLDVSVGDPTKASEYNSVADNTEFNRDKGDVGHDWAISGGTGKHTRAKTLIEYPSGVETGYNAQRMIYVDLDDPLQLWDQQAFFQQIQDTSWHNELGDPPIHGAMWIDEAQDALVWWDRETGSAYMTFTAVNGNILYSGDLNGLMFLDGILYVAQAPTGNGAILVDFLRDASSSYSAGGAGYRGYAGNIAERNDGNGIITYDVNLQIVNATVNAIAACRDPELLDEFGRPQRRWAAGTDGGVSVYSPAAVAIYDSSTVADTDHLIVLSDGQMLDAYDDATRYSIRWKRSIFTINADAWIFDDVWINTGTDAEDIAWTDGAAVTGVAALEDKSISGDGSPMVIFGSDEGLYVAHADAADNPGAGSLIRLTDTYNSPTMKGDCRGCWPLMSVVDVAPGGKDLTNVNAVTFVDGGPAGSYANFVAASSQRLDHADDAFWTMLQALTIECWFYRDLDSGGDEGLFGQWDNTVGANQAYTLHIESDDTIQFHVNAAGGGDVICVGPAAALATWYHVVGTYDGATQRLYVNGELVDSDAQTGNVTDSGQELTVGYNHQGGAVTNLFDGRIGGCCLQAAVKSQEEVRYDYQRGVRRMQSAIDVNDTIPAIAVVGVTVDPHGDYFGVIANDQLTTFDELVVPVAQDTAPAGTLRDAAIKSVPGLDDPIYLLGTSTRVEVVQGDTRP